MQKEVTGYIANNKELLLQLLSSSYQSTLLTQLLSTELLGIESGQTYPDFLELLTGQQLYDSVKMLQDLIQNSHWAKSPDSRDAFSLEKKRRFKVFADTLESMLENRSKHNKIGPFIHRQRKHLGFPDDVTSLKLITDILDECFRRGLLDVEELHLINYPGSFNPFPHLGHVEVAQLAFMAASEYLQGSPRILVTTSENSTENKKNQDTFSMRVENMYRGFFNDSYSTILGIPGDVLDKAQRISQLLTLSQFDHEQRLRFVLGSDNFIKKVLEAKHGDSYALFLFDVNNQLFLSTRPDENKQQLVSALAEAKRNFNVDPIILPEQKITLSGTHIRSLGQSQERLYYPNNYILEK